MLIAKWETRTPVEPKFKQEIIRKILKFVIESRPRRPRSIQDIAEHIKLPESEALAYMDILTKQQHWVRRTREGAQEGYHIRFASRDGFEGYVFERDDPAHCKEAY